MAMKRNTAFITNANFKLVLISQEKKKWKPGGAMKANLVLNVSQERGLWE